MTAGTEQAIVRTVETVDRLFTLMRSVQTHGVSNTNTRQAAAALTQSVNAGELPYALQFVAGAVFRNRQMIPMEAQQAARVEELSKSLSNLRAHELTFERPLTEDAVMLLGEVLVSGAEGRSDMFSRVRIAGLKVRALSRLESERQGEWIDAALYSINQIAKATTWGQKISADESQPWPWSEGIQVVRAVENANRLDSEAADRALELAPGTWTPIRRALSATKLSLTVTRFLGLSPLTSRAAAHVQLALGVQGYTARDGGSVTETAALVRSRFLEGPVTNPTGIDPHRLRATSIAHLLAHPDSANEAPAAILGLCHLLYHLERVRRPSQLDVELTRPDLLAYAVGNAGKAFEPVWVRALCEAVGAVSAGTPVKLTNGERAIAVGAGAPGDIWRPRVFLHGEAIVPAQQVLLSTPIER